MEYIDNVEELERLYDAVNPLAISKVRTTLTPLYQQWIESSRFLVLTTVGPRGTNASPRGDDKEVVRIVDRDTLWLPDWRGNNRLDSLRNIVEDGRVSLMFMITGNNNVVRVNGCASLTSSTDATMSFKKGNKTPRTVIVVKVQEVYFQCAKALMRARLWEHDANEKVVPTAGEFLNEVQVDFDAASYDSGYSEYAKDKMW